MLYCVRRWRFSDLKLLAVLETDEVIRRDRLLDRHRGLCRLERRLGAAARNPHQRRVNLADQARDFRGRRRIVGEIGRDDIGGEIDEILAGASVMTSNLSQYRRAPIPLTVFAAHKTTEFEATRRICSRTNNGLARPAANYFTAAGRVGAQFVDRGKAHLAFRHLRLDRAVGIERIGHAVDHARFEHGDARRRLARRRRRVPQRARRLRLACAARRAARATAALQASSNVRGRGRPFGAGGPDGGGRNSVGSGPARGSRPRVGARVLPRARREQQIALRLWSRRRSLTRRHAPEAARRAGGVASCIGQGRRPARPAATEHRRPALAARAPAAGPDADAASGGDSGSGTSRAITLQLARPPATGQQDQARARRRARRITISVLPKLNSLIGMPYKIAASPPAPEPTPATIMHSHHRRRPPDGPVQPSASGSRDRPNRYHATYRHIAGTPASARIVSLQPSATIPS